jgi:hypothetical protein
MMGAIRARLVRRSWLGRIRPGLVVSLLLTISGCASQRPPSLLETAKAAAYLDARRTCMLSVEPEQRQYAAQACHDWARQMTGQ